MSTKTRKIFGGIVPHHAIAHEKIEQYFQQIACADCEVVVLLGPNHFDLGSKDAQTANIDYGTPSGRLERSTFLINQLAQEEVFDLAGDVFAKEHSITALVNYIKKYFPKAQLVPIILKRKVSDDQCDAIASRLVKLLENKKAMVLASVDFSHYLTEKMADFHDQISISAIKNFDFVKIKQLELDSRPSIRILLQYLTALSAKKMTLFSHNNSLDFRSDVSRDVVTYVFSYFTQGEQEREIADSVLCLGRIDLTNLGGSSFSDIGRMFESVDLSIAEMEKGYGILMDGENRFHTTVAQMFFEKGIYTINRNGEPSREVINKDKEYLTNENVRYLDSFGVGKNYFIKWLTSGKLACIIVNKEMGQALSDWSELLSKAAHEADYRIVYIFWPKGYPLEKMRTEAHRLINQGMDVVIGNNEEILPLEMYKEKIIAYSLGSFIGGGGEKGESCGMALSLIFSPKIRHYVFPIRNIKGIPYKK